MFQRTESEFRLQCRTKNVPMEMTQNDIIIYSLELHVLALLQVTCKICHRIPTFLILEVVEESRISQSDTINKVIGLSSRMFT